MDTEWSKDALECFKDWVLDSETNDMYLMKKASPQGLAFDLCSRQIELSWYFVPRPASRGRRFPALHARWRFRPCCR
jgi:hypothetical protein